MHTKCVKAGHLNSRRDISKWQKQQFRQASFSRLRSHILRIPRNFRYRVRRPEVQIRSFVECLQLSEDTYSEASTELDDEDDCIPILNLQKHDRMQIEEEV